MKRRIRHTQLCTSYDIRSHFLCQFFVYIQFSFARCNDYDLKWMKWRKKNLCTISTFYFVWLVTMTTVAGWMEIHANVSVQNWQPNRIKYTEKVDNERREWIELTVNWDWIKALNAAAVATVAIAVLVAMLSCVRNAFPLLRHQYIIVIFESTSGALTFFCFILCVLCASICRMKDFIFHIFRFYHRLWFFHLSLHIHFILRLCRFYPRFRLTIQWKVVSCQDVLLNCLSYFLGSSDSQEPSGFIHIIIKTTYKRFKQERHRRSWTTVE